MSVRTVDTRLSRLSGSEYVQYQRTYIGPRVLFTHLVVVLYVPLHTYVVLYVIFSSSVYG